VEVVYMLGLAVAFMAGCMAGWFLTQAHFERIASAEREYECELAEVEELYAARAMLRRMSPGDQPGGSHLTD
jgi:hypothetical protein